MTIQSYGLRSYGAMIADRVRMDAYAAALERLVRPGMVVADIGSGPGIFGLLAARAGARRVFLVEPDDSIHLARRMAAANGLADRLECLQAVSTEVVLPEPADLIVSDLRGILPIAFPNLGAIADARRRHLAPGGMLVPARDTILAAPVEAPAEHAELVSPWTERSRGLDLGAALEATLNQWGRVRLTPRALLAEPAQWVVLDYSTREDTGADGTMTWSVERDGAAHGLAAWFRCDLAEGIWFETSPGAPETIYHQAFFPWPRPVQLRRGDRVTVTLRARLVGGEYIWSWETSLLLPGREPVSFRQSTLRGEALSADRLRRRAHTFVPVLGADGEVDLAILRRMDGRRTLGEIASEVLERFPGRFAGWESALARVGALSEQTGDQPPAGGGAPAPSGELTE